MSGLLQHGSITDL